jgi:hypothetical protein
VAAHKGTIPAQSRYSWAVMLFALAIGKAALWDLMASKKTWDRIGEIYDNVHIALWASLISFLLYFAFVVAPQMPAAKSRYERLQLQQIAAQNEFYMQVFQ